MNIIDRRRVDDLMQTGLDLDIGRSITQGIDLIKKDIGLFIAFTIVALLMLGISNFIPFLGQFIGPLITPVIFAGFFIACHKVAQNEYLEFSDFFRGFDYAGPLLVLGGINAGLALIMNLPIISMVGFGGFGGFDSISYGLQSMGVLMLIFYLIMLVVFVYFSICWTFASCFMIFGDMEGWEAMETSRKIVSRNFWNVLGFAIVVGLFAAVGYLACIVGILFTLPAAQASIYAAFRDFMGLDRPDFKGGFGEDVYDHLVD